MPDTVRLVQGFGDHHCVGHAADADNAVVAGDCPVHVDAGDAQAGAGRRKSGGRLRSRGWNSPRQTGWARTTKLSWESCCALNAA